MKSAIYISFIGVMCLLLLSGCTNVKQLNRITFITLIGVDTADEGVEVHALGAIASRFAELSPSGGTSSGQAAPHFILSGKGKTVSDALYQMKKQTSRDLNLGQTKIILISDELAKQDIRGVFDSFVRKEELQIVSWIGITHGSTKPVLEIKPEVPDSISDYIVDAFSRTGTESMQILPAYLHTFISYLHEPDISPYAMTVQAMEEGNKLTFPTLAVFQDHRMVGELNSEEIMFIQLLKHQGVHPASFTHQNQTFNLLNYKCKTTYRNEAFYTTLHIALNLENDAQMTSYSISELKRISSELEEYLEKQCMQAIKKTQDLKTDPVGFGIVYRKAHHGKFPNKQWIKEDYPHIPHHVTVKIDLERTGEIV